MTQSLSGSETLQFIPVMSTIRLLGGTVIVLTFAQPRLLASQILKIFKIQSLQSHLTVPCEKTYCMKQRCFPIVPKFARSSLVSHSSGSGR